MKISMNVISLSWLNQSHKQACTQFLAKKGNEELSLIKKYSLSKRNNKFTYNNPPPKLTQVLHYMHFIRKIENDWVDRTLNTFSW